MASTTKPGYKAGGILKGFLNLFLRPTLGPTVQIVLCAILSILTTWLFVSIWDGLLLRMGWEIPSTRFTTLIDWKMWIFLSISYYIWSEVYSRWWINVRHLTAHQLLFLGQRIIIGGIDLTDSKTGGRIRINTYQIVTEGGKSLPFYGSLFSINETAISTASQADMVIHHTIMTKGTDSEEPVEYLVTILLKYRSDDPGRAASVDPNDVQGYISSDIKATTLETIGDKPLSELRKISPKEMNDALQQGSLAQNLAFIGYQVLKFELLYHGPKDETLKQEWQQAEIEKIQSQRYDEQQKAIMERAVAMAGGESRWETLSPELRLKFIDRAYSMDKDSNITVVSIDAGNGKVSGFTEGKVVEHALGKDRKGKGRGRGRGGKRVDDDDDDEDE